MNDSADCYINSLLYVWPVVHCLATHSAVGDLIRISRTNSTFRAVLHGFGSDNHLLEQDAKVDPTTDGTVRRAIRIGRHQTQHWANLKALARYSCSSPAHTKGENVHPCKYCSLPICEACIVRSSFGNPNENTFRNRIRYLCPTCWRAGNLRKDHRYPADHVSREHIWRGRNYSQRGSFCTCTAKADAWLCIPCKESQNILASSNGVPIRDQIDLKGKTKQYVPVECYGTACQNVVVENDRDRRRICLWCSKPLPRQYGGEDRLRWDNKLIEARAINAASRSADIEEWARNRFKTLTMSRREMRGTVQCLALTGHDTAEHDKPQFLRHLDAVNYRRYLPEGAAPEPEAVWRSKNGQWQYKRAFLEGVGRLLQAARLDAGIDAKALKSLTAQSGLLFARTNLEMREDQEYEQLCALERTQSTIENAVYLPVALRARVLEWYVVEGWTLEALLNLLEEEFSIRISEKELAEVIQIWQSNKPRKQKTAFGPPTPSDSEDDGDVDAIESSLSPGIREEQSLGDNELADDGTRGDAESDLMDLQETNRALLHHVLQASMLPPDVAFDGPRPDEPPPYSP